MSVVALFPTITPLHRVVRFRRLVSEVRCNEQLQSACCYWQWRFLWSGHTRRRKHTRVANCSLFIHLSTVSHAVAFWPDSNKDAGKNNLPPLTPFVLYSFRHTFLTRLGESG